MSKLTLKQQAIQEAWIELIGQELYDICKHHIDPNNGAVSCQYKCYHPAFRDLKIDYDSWATSNDSVMRPKSIAGIDNNNGWVRISGDGSNLPDQTEQRFEVIEYIDGKSRVLTNNCSYMGVSNKFEFDNATHYRPVVEHPKPVY